MHVGVCVIVYGHFEVQRIQNNPFESDDLFLRDGLFAFGGHGGDFGRVDLVHFAGQKQESQSDLLIVLFGDKERLAIQAIEVGDCEVLSVAGHLLIVGQDPANSVFSILILE